MGKHAKLKEKQEWSNEKLHHENARKLRRIYFIDLEDKEFKETIKNARKKLETSVAPAMPCKIMKKNCGSDGSNKIKTKLCVYKEFLEIVGNGSPTGSVLKGYNCSFRHDIIKRGNVTQSNTSPNSFMQRKASRTRSPRGRSLSGRNVSMALQGLPQRNLHQFIL